MNHSFTLYQILKLEKSQELTQTYAEWVNKFDHKRIKTLEAELDEIHDQRTKEAQIRSDLRWIEDGERKIKYFLKT